MYKEKVKVNYNLHFILSDGIVACMFCKTKIRVNENPYSRIFYAVTYSIHAILKPRIQYDQYCTLLDQSDCRYFVR